MPDPYILWFKGHRVCRRVDVPGIDMKRLLAKASTATSGSSQLSRWRVFFVQFVLLHVGVYAVGMIGLFLINILTGITQPWFLFPMFGWGLLVAAHALVTYLIMNASIARRVVATMERRKDPAYRPLPRNASEIEELLARGRLLLRQMHDSAWTIPDLAVRNEALTTCEASERVLAAIEEHPDELPLARDFINRFLDPAAKLIRDYARLARRDVPSAREILREVEQADFSRLTARAHAMYDRVHRGTMIDLAVAREMMALGGADPDAPDVAAKTPA